MRGRGLQTKPKILFQTVDIPIGKAGMGTRARVYTTRTCTCLARCNNQLLFFPILKVIYFLDEVVIILRSLLKVTDFGVRICNLSVDVDGHIFFF